MHQFLHSHPVLEHHHAHLSPGTQELWCVLLVTLLTLASCETCMYSYGVGPEGDHADMHLHGHDLGAGHMAEATYHTLATKCLGDV